MQQAQKNRPWPRPQTGDGAQQPLDVVSRRTADRMQGVAQRPFEQAASSDPGGDLPSLKGFGAQKNRKMSAFMRAGGVLQGRLFID
jgi:hypothetical protein